MNILIVNPTHPKVNHISSVRAYRFACALSKMGHKVALLCATPVLDGPLNTAPPRNDWDWSQPYIWVSAYETTRHKYLKFLPKKVSTIIYMYLYGGLRRKWVLDSIEVVVDESARYKPDVIWATFGKMESLFVAFRLSKKLDIPWVLDIKDNWEFFVPNGLRKLMIARIQGFKAVTVNSEDMLNSVKKLFRIRAKLVYSGVDEFFFNRSIELSSKDRIFNINLVGSIYFPDRLKEFIQGILMWGSTIKDKAHFKISLNYIGNDFLDIEDEIRMLNEININFSNLGYLKIDELADKCNSAAVNCYIAHKANFHHKILELLACGRPVIAYPFERYESIKLAEKINGTLIIPSSVTNLASVLQRIYEDWPVNIYPALTSVDECFSWEAQARYLEEVLNDAAK